MGIASKDYDFVGHRTSKHCEQDMEYTLSKRDIDKYFESMVEDIGDLRAVSIEDEDYDLPEEIFKKDPMDSAFRLGYLQAKKEIIEMLNDYEVYILELADSVIKERNK
jgi:hypothetical protein